MPNRRTTRAKSQTQPTARPSENEDKPRPKSSYLVLGAELEGDGQWHELGRQLDTNAGGAKKATAEEILKRGEDNPLRQALVAGKLVLATVPLQSWQPTRVRYERPEPTLRFDD